jgi:hypothetical protein
MQSVYEATGGSAGLLRLAEAWHSLLAIRYLVMYRQRSVTTVRQRLMSTAVTFAALTEFWSAITATSQSRHHGRPGDGYHGHAL